jgi:caspase domain-containing protein
MTSIPVKPTNSATQTHVLIIGVGEYPYLRGGIVADIPAAMGLGQLTSPPVSAAALANWFLDDYNNPTAPLGSLEILLSPGPLVRPDTSAISVESATFDHIKTAFNAWDARAHTNARNIAIFYFCGHGMQKEQALLLPEDFGEDQNQLWDRAINIDRTILGMEACNARSQLYLLDACREQPLDMLKFSSVDARTLKATKAPISDPRDAPVLRAAPPRGKAFADEGQVSHFTSSLIRCLNGIGADDHNGNAWVVDTASLGKGMKITMGRIRLPNDRRGTCSVAGESHFTTVLHHIPGDTEVLGFLECDPGTATALADFMIDNGMPPPLQRTRTDEPWEFTLRSGTYNVTASFDPGTAFQPVVQKAQIARPPEFRRTIKVVP